jgi:DNA repair exonuclease SbcCD ATPase subunit
MKKQMKIVVKKQKVRLEMEQQLGKLDDLVKAYSRLEAEAGSRYEVYRRLCDIQNIIRSISSAIVSIEEDLE